MIPLILTVIVLGTSAIFICRALRSQTQPFRSAASPWSGGPPPLATEPHRLPTDSDTALARCGPKADMIPLASANTAADS